MNQNHVNMTINTRRKIVLKMNIDNKNKTNLENHIKEILSP